MKKIKLDKKRFCINSTLKTLLLLREGVNRVSEITTQKYEWSEGINPDELDYYK